MMPYESKISKEFSDLNVLLEVLQFPIITKAIWPIFLIADGITDHLPPQHIQFIYLGNAIGFLSRSFATTFTNFGYLLINPPPL